MVRIAVIAGALVLCWASPTWAQPADADPAPVVHPERGSARERGPSRRTAPAPDLQDALDELRAENEDLRDELELLKEDLAYTDSQVQTLLPVKARLSGYLDIGFFHVGGDGTGFRSDLGNLLYPEYDEVVPGTWVFMGDPLSTMINGRGEPADTGDSRALTFDSVDAGGAPTFLVNALNLQLYSGIGTQGSLHASIDFVPRGRDVSNSDGLFLGDFVDVKLAYGEYRLPMEALSLELYAGKFDSVIGREYRVTESPDRITVAPSLICRYVCGHPIGVRARALMLDERLIVNAAITNGSHFWEGFDFADEIDSNSRPTGAARVSYALPIPGIEHLEIGASGAIGAQDAQPESDPLQWHAGGDLLLRARDLEVTAEYVKGKAPGTTSTIACDDLPCLDYQGAYGLLAYRLSNRFIPYARVDWRDALHQAGASFVYISQLWRATAGLRVEIGSKVILKADYTVNRELGRIPQFANDVLATALILKY